MINLTRVLWLVFALVAIGLGTFYCVAAVHLFPVMGIDSSAHIVPILNYKSGHGLGGVVLPLTRDYDPTGQHRFLQYPPLFHLTVAALIRHADFENIYVCLAGFATADDPVRRVDPATFGGRGGAQPPALGCPGRREPRRGFDVVLPVAVLGPRRGAGDTVLILGAILVLRAPARWQPVIAGVCIGVVAATQIAVACLTGILYRPTSAHARRTEQRRCGAGSCP